MSKTKTATRLIPVQDMRQAYASLNVDTKFNTRTGKLTVYTRNVKIFYAILDMGTWYIVEQNQN